MELSVNGQAALLDCLFEIANRSHDVSVRHVPRIIILVETENAEVVLVVVMNGLEVSGILRDDGELVLDGVGEVIFVVLAVHGHGFVGWPHDSMSSLRKKISK